MQQLPGVGLRVTTALPEGCQRVARAIVETRCRLKGRGTRSWTCCRTGRSAEPAPGTRFGSSHMVAMSVRRTIPEGVVSRLPQEGGTVQRSSGVEGASTIYACVAEGCERLALQRCIRCERYFCNEHVHPVERDLPTRGLQIPEPYWYCAQCLSRLRSTSF